MSEETKPDTNTYENAVKLLAVYTDAENRLAAIQQTVDEAQLQTLDEHLEDYAKLQQAKTDAQAALEVIARAHPQWFEGERTVKTPYGSLHMQHTSALNVDDEEVTLALIEKAGRKPDFVVDKPELNLKALSALPDEELAKYRITRVKGESCTVKAAKVQLGKAVKTATAKKAKAKSEEVAA
jgi:Bacteriophage Mu Gam like protein